MLVELLKHLSESGDIVTLAELASKLKVSERHLRMLIDESVRLGYLEDLSQRAAGQAGCGATCRCGGCSCCSTVSASPSIWEVTEKGRRLLAARRA